MACFNFYTSTIQAPELVSIPSYHNLKPTTNHSISTTNKSTTKLHSRVSYKSQKIIKASSETMSTTIEKLGIKIVKNPPETKLTDLGVRSWPK